MNPAGWNSLDDQLPGWAENVGTASKLLETNFQGSTPLAPNGQLTLGGIFVPGANEDLTGRYTTTDGLVNLFNVQFVTEAAGLPGDYNQNNKVDAADYTIWRDRLGSRHGAAESTITPGVGADDYTLWKKNFGQQLRQRLARAAPRFRNRTLCLLLVAGLTTIGRARTARA